MFYINLLKTFQESEDSLQPDEKYRVPYAKKAVRHAVANDDVQLKTRFYDRISSKNVYLYFVQFKLSSKYYLDEAKWSSEKYAPSFEEHVEVSVMSSGFPTLAVVLLMGAGDLATREAFEWAIGVPPVVSASGEVARFLNDIASYRKGKNKKDAASSVECYSRERGVSGEESAAAIAGMAEHAWRTINRSCMEVGGELLPAARLVVNLTKTLEVTYLGGRDAYTFAGDLRDLVVSLFLDGPAV
jgi:eudesmane-5,11-diol synthase